MKKSRTTGFRRRIDALIAGKFGSERLKKSRTTGLRHDCATTILTISAIGKNQIIPSDGIKTFIFPDRKAEIVGPA